MPTKSMEAQINARGVLGNFPRFGKLRKGAPKTEKGAGRDQDYFRLTLETPYEHLRPAFEQLFGTEPREFHNVLLAADSPDQAFTYWKEDWAHARLLKRCDEETIIVHWDDKRLPDPGYSTQPLECTCDPLKRTCKDHGRMDIVIPALFDLTGEWGKFTVETTSIYDVAALRSYMKMAESFMQKLPNVAFWSVPFTIGRAMRTVPVTINGKRSLKPMSLLYAKIEPEFNQQIFTPMLTRPAQLLLAGGDLSAVEPQAEEPEFEAEFIQAASWDRDYVMQKTIHLFDHEDHWINTTNKMEVAGELTEDMDDVHAIEAILQNREKRKAEKASGNGSKSRKKGSNSSAAQSQAQSSAAGAEWLQNAQRLNGFIAKAHSDLNLSTGLVLKALQDASEPEQIENIQDFTGSDLQAWAACIAYKVVYQPDQVAAFAPLNSPVWKAAIQIIEAHDQRLAEMPF